MTTPNTSQMKALTGLEGSAAAGTGGGTSNGGGVGRSGAIEAPGWEKM